MPCHRVKTTGRYAFGSWLNRIVDPASRCRSTLLSRWIAPVKNVPAGTITWPPPHRLQAAIAALHAAVQSVTPSPTAPNLVIGKYLPGNRGRRTDATIRSAAASAGSQVRAARPVKALPLAVAAPAGAASSRIARALAPAIPDSRSSERRSISWDIFVLPPIDGPGGFLVVPARAAASAEGVRRCRPGGSLPVPG